jgi:hypothetical protein
MIDDQAADTGAAACVAVCKEVPLLCAHITGRALSTRCVLCFTSAPQLCSHMCCTLQVLLPSTTLCRVLKAGVRSKSSSLCHVGHRGVFFLKRLLFIFAEGHCSCTLRCVLDAVFSGEELPSKGCRKAVVSQATE